MKCNQELYDPNCEIEKPEQECSCVSQKVKERFHICDMFSITESCACYKGFEYFEVNGMLFIKVGYEICIKYIDCSEEKKSVRKEGTVLFFALPDMISMQLSVHISPPKIETCEDETTAKFTVSLCL